MNHWLVMLICLVGGFAFVINRVKHHKFTNKPIRAVVTGVFGSAIFCLLAGGIHFLLEGGGFWAYYRHNPLFFILIIIGSMVSFLFTNYED